MDNCCDGVSDGRVDPTRVVWRRSSYMLVRHNANAVDRLSVVKPLDMLLLQFGIPSHSTSDIQLLLVPLNVI